MKTEIEQKNKALRWIKEFCEENDPCFEENEIYHCATIALQEKGK